MQWLEAVVVALHNVETIDWLVSQSHWTETPFVSDAGGAPIAELKPPGPAMGQLKV